MIYVEENSNYEQNSDAYFKLFEKTLRAEKKDTIFYVSYYEGGLLGYLYDSGGLSQEKRWEGALAKNESLEDALKKKLKNMEKRILN